MANHRRSEGDSLLDNQIAGQDLHLVDLNNDESNYASPITPPTTGLSRQDTSRLTQGSGGRRYSFDAEESVTEGRPEPSYATSLANDTNVHELPTPNDSTAQLSPPLVPAIDHLAKPARVTTIEIAHPHGGGHGGHPGHGHRKHPKKPKKGPRSPKDNILAWKFELLAALLAIALLVTEIVLLVHYNGKFLFFVWPHDWKINAVLAFLTTILEAAIAFYVGACIGQLKWYWFRRKQRRLVWLEIMTEARQPPGAIRLLLRKGMWRQFAALGAVIIILLLGVNTFTQNVITEDLAPLYLGPDDGFVPINTNYTWRDIDTTVGLGTQQPLPQMVAAIQNGFYSFSAKSRTLGASAWTYCGGDRCDFGEYQSLAVCSKCADITDEVLNPCPGGNCATTDYYTLKNGIDLSLLATRGALNISSDTDFVTDPTLAKEVGPMIVRFHALVADHIGSNRTGRGASATECAAWWCVKTYSGHVVNSTLREQVLDSWTDKSVGARTTYLQERNINLHPPAWFIDDAHPRNQSYCTFQAGSGAQVGLQNFLAVKNPATPFEPFLAGSATIHSAGVDTTFNYTSLLAGGLISDGSETDFVMDKIHLGFKKMAEQMTVSIRLEYAADGNKEYSFGSATIQEQIFRVRWAWLVYPILLVLVSIIFLIVTMIITRKQEVWKASILPMIFHAFGGQDRAQFVQLDTVEEMREVSKNHGMLLGDDAGGHVEFVAKDAPPEHYRYEDEAGEMVGGGAGAILDGLGQAIN